MKILHLITELDTGGAQKALARLLARLDRRRFEPAVACLYNGDKAVAQEIRRLGIPVTDLGLTAPWRGDGLWRLYRLLRRERPAILHTWLFHANVPGRVLGRLARVPLIISAERTLGMESQMRYRLNRLTAPLADRVICVSQAVADFAAQTIGIAPDKLVVIPNGVPLADFAPGERAPARARLGLPASAFVVGMVGRLEPVKGVPDLLAAFARLPSRHPETLLLLVGAGSQQRPLESLARRRGLGQRVRFLGHREDVAALLPALDLLALSSHWEGMPNAVLEAMAAGLPVVATAVGGAPEVVVDGVTGLLVPPRDPQALAQAIAGLLSDPERRRRMGRAGRERAAAHFRVEQMVERTERLYRDLISSAR